MKTNTRSWLPLAGANANESGNGPAANKTNALWQKSGNLAQSTSGTNVAANRGRCTHGPRAACPGCPVPIPASVPASPSASINTADEAEDFLAALVAAVDPFNRVETEREGVRVFDTTWSVPTGSGEIYVHKDGCGCEGKHVA